MLYDLTIDALLGGLWLLALARVTRLLTKDALTDVIREWAYRRSHGAETTLTYFVQCPWCVGMWLALGTAWVPLVLAERALWLWPFAALAASHLIGLAAENLEADDDIEVEITDAE